VWASRASRADIVRCDRRRPTQEGRHESGSFGRRRLAVSDGSISLKTSPPKSCGIGIRNNRIGQSAFLNQRCALAGPSAAVWLRINTRGLDIWPSNANRLLSPTR
jgi:hypothetical protein